MVLTALLTRDSPLRLPPLPENARARAKELRAKGVAALEERRYEAAQACFFTLGKLKEVEGALYLSKLGIALTWRKQREFSKALGVLQEALGLGDDRFVLLDIGVILHQMERFAKALDVLDKVKERWPDDPDVWVYRMAPLTSMEKGQSALESAEQAFSLRHKSSDRGRLLYESAAGLSIAMGLDSLERRWLPDLETATKAFIKWRDRARRDKQAAAFNQAVREFKKELSEYNDTFEEFMLGVRLASIRNPFRRWEAIAREISKVWPEGVSAVDAIREQRE